jgi:hypothetical protein
MSIDMYVSASQSQARSVGTMCKQQVQGYEQAQKAINDFALNSPFLSGKAYDSAKAYFSSVLYPLAQGGMLLSEAVEQAVKKFPEEYIAQVDSGDLKQSDLERKIKEANRLLSQAEDIRHELSSSNTPALLKTFQLARNTMLMGIYGNVKKELEEQLQKLLAFNASSPSIFSEIASLQSAVNQGLAQTKTSWNAATGTFTVPSDLSWAKTIFTIKQASKKDLENRIDTIKNGKEAPFTKSELVIKAYEDYLFANNREAFEKYWAARKKYGDAWPNDVDEEIIKSIESELTKTLNNSGIDIKAIIRSMGNDILDVNGTKNSMLPLDYFYFMNLVDTGQPLDLKTRAYSEEYNFSLWSRQWDKGIPGDYLGNYLFGYFGQGFLMFDGPLLKYGAGVAQGWSDKDIGKWWDNLWNGNYGDNPEDAKYIQDGIKDYKNRK